MADITRNSANAAPLLGAIVKNGKAGGAGTVPSVVYLDSNGDWVEADSDAAGTGEAWGIVVSTHDGEATFADDDAIAVVVFGPMAGYSGMTPGAPGWTASDRVAWRCP